MHMQSCPTVTPWIVVSQTPLSLGFSGQEYWSGLPYPIPGDIPDSGMEPGLITHYSRVYSANTPAGK